MENSRNQFYDAVVIGAGMSGMAAASDLSRAGRRVMVVDKGRGVGGRMANRRIGAAVFDHGAQFITARSECVFSKPLQLSEEACAVLHTSPPLVMAGDAFAGPKVEGAARSGWAAADILLELSAPSVLQLGAAGVWVPGNVIHSPSRTLRRDVVARLFLVSAWRAAVVYLRASVSENARRRP